MSQYRTRRADLRKAVPGSMIVIFGRTEAESDDLHYSFFQEPNFYYLTGWREPGAILVLAPLPEAQDTPGYAALEKLPREILFLPQRAPLQEKWTGRKLGPDDSDAALKTGFDVVRPAETFEMEFRKLLEFYASVQTLTNRPQAKALESLAPLRPVGDVALEIGKLRMHKSPEEIALIQHATDASVAAHLAAWKRAAPGLYEYQVAATMTDVYFEYGCERSSYAPIVGSGPNTTTLHYSRNDRRMDRGELLLMDVAAECSGYASDITRTIPVGGKFSARQREIYDIVLGAQKAAIAAIKPGMTLGKKTPNSLHKIAFDYINTHGKDLHGEPLGKYFTHGLGHHVGLDVHDANDPSAALEAGMVITMEPGIYIPEETIGVRIEDTLVVTETGARNMSEALPREPAEIENALRVAASK